MAHRRWLFLLSLTVPAVIVLAGCGASDAKPASSPAPAQPSVAAAPAAAVLAGEADAGETATKIRVADMRFSPEVERIKAGESIAWHFEDIGVVHSATAFNGLYDSDLKSSGRLVVLFD